MVSMAKSSIKFCILFAFFSLYPFSLNSCHFESQNVTKRVPALYVFGDSLVDSGNNNHLPTKSKANFLPYGIDFNGGKPTGRATNGKTVADYIALNLGLPLVPPYLGLLEFQRSSITTGMNYASAGCGILPDSGRKNGLCLSFDNQTSLYQRTVENDLPTKFKKQSELKNHLSKSLFFVSMGVNDYFNNEFSSANSNPEVFGHFLLNEFSIRLQRLYNLGAGKFLVNNIPPAGCFPRDLIEISQKGICNETKNKMVTFYNRKLPEMLQQLQSQLPGSTFAHSDYFAFFLELRANARKYEITDILNPCCPEKYNGTFGCQSHTATCKKRDTHLFFDQAHPSQIANYIYSRRCFSESSICTPLNLNQLVAA